MVIWTVLMKRVQSGLRKLQSKWSDPSGMLRPCSLRPHHVIEITKVAHTSINIKQNRTTNTENIYESLIFANIVDSGYLFRFHDL